MGPTATIAPRPGITHSLRARVRGWWWRLASRLDSRRGDAARAAYRVMYALDLTSTTFDDISSPVEFRELTGSELAAEMGRSVVDESSLAPLESGVIVGILDGRQVYRVSYIRGDAMQLQRLPDAWRPRGRVLFLHDGVTEPAYRHRGIHTSALRWLLRREQRHDIAHAVCVVHRDNPIAEYSVRSLGFRRVGRSD